jgi:hypothetical protein
MDHSMEVWGPDGGTLCMILLFLVHLQVGVDLGLLQFSFSIEFQIGSKVLSLGEKSDLVMMDRRNENQ